MQKSIPVLVWETGAILMNGKFRQFEFMAGYACQHRNKTAYYTDDLVGMYSICDDCHTRVPEEA